MDQPLVRKCKRKKIWVYISGPISIGNMVINARKAMDVFDHLIKLGYTPICPHWSIFQEFAYPETCTYEYWLEYDKQLLERIDCILRLPGESKGADIETAHAKVLGIPVFHDIEELKRWGNNWLAEEIAHARHIRSK
jgi:hypothetical protein